MAPSTSDLHPLRILCQRDGKKFNYQKTTECLKSSKKKRKFVKNSWNLRRWLWIDHCIEIKKKKSYENLIIFNSFNLIFEETYFFWQIIETLSFSSSSNVVQHIEQQQCWGCGKDTFFVLIFFLRLMLDFQILLCCIESENVIINFSFKNIFSPLCAFNVGESDNEMKYLFSSTLWWWPTKVTIS